MLFSIFAQPCAPGQILPLLPGYCQKAASAHYNRAPVAWRQILSTLAIGVKIFLPGQTDGRFMVDGVTWSPCAPEGADTTCIATPMLLALKGCAGGFLNLEARKSGYSLAVVTLSDKGAEGDRTDKSGPAIIDLLAKTGLVSFCRRFLLPDERDCLTALLARLALMERYDLIVTTGGTGPCERDITPQAARPLLAMELPGFGQAMMMKSLAITPHAMLSRAFAGVIGKALLISVPGSLKAATENLEAVLPALGHTLAKINGDNTDCGG